jgi:hypothetical protein
MELENQIQNEPLNESPLTESLSSNVSSDDQRVVKIKKKTSRRRTIKANGMQNIRLPIKIELSDKMIEIAEKRGMSTTLGLYRLYIEQGIENDLKRIAELEKYDSVSDDQISKIIGDESST